LLEDSGSFLRFLSVDRVLDRLWSRICLLRCWDFTHVSGFGYYFIWMNLRVDDMATWGVCYISAVMFYCWNFCACQLWIIWRRDVYFLNIYYIRVIYRFNRSRALQVSSNPGRMIKNDIEWWRIVWKTLE